MKVLALSLADDSRRYSRGYPPKGAQMFLNPDLEIAALMRRASEDQFTYQDEKVEVLNLKVPFDLALISTDFWQEPRIREVALELKTRDRPIVLFGPLATTRAWEFDRVADSVVVGNIMNAWPELRADVEQGRVKPVYQAARRPAYGPVDLERTLKPAFDPSFQVLRAILGCRCPESVRPFCRQYLYHRHEIVKRDPEEVADEVPDLRRKHIFLLDEDVAQDRDYYGGLLARIWRYRREWTVLAGRGIFEDTGFIRMLAKAGVRIAHLNESWLSQALLLEARTNRRLLRELRNQVRLLHRNRLLVGARVSLFLEPGQDFDYEGTSHVLQSLSIDFLLARTFKKSSGQVAEWSSGQVKTLDHLATGSLGHCSFQPSFISYEPGLTSDKPTWWKHEFYDLNAILRRSLRRPARIGFYSTLFYYYPRSFAYRQNFLEGIAYPP